MIESLRSTSLVTSGMKDPPAGVCRSTGGGPGTQAQACAASLTALSGGTRMRAPQIVSFLLTAREALSPQIQFTTFKPGCELEARLAARHGVEVPSTDSGSVSS